MTDPYRDGEASVRDHNALVEDTLSRFSPQDLTHQKVRSRLSDYLDGSLSPIERRQFDGHLEQCPDCRAFRDTLRQTIHALDSLPLHRAPAEAKDRLRDHVRENIAHRSGT